MKKRWIVLVRLTLALFVRETSADISRKPYIAESSFPGLQFATTSMGQAPVTPAQLAR